MTSEPARRSESTRFVAGSREGLREASLWHPQRHHVKMLPRRIEALIEMLELPPDGTVLDFGSADAPYAALFPAETEFVAADLPGNPTAQLTLNADGTVPAPDQSFDAVLSTQVLEHVEDPALYLAECLRVLRPGGRLLLSTHGFFFYHPDPHDLWRWTCEGLRYEVGRAGFEVVHFEGIIGMLPSGLQMVQDSVYGRLPRVLRPLFAVVMQSLVALFDRLEGQASKDLNAQVFALVARKP